jgi:hypothetical protein
MSRGPVTGFAWEDRLHVTAATDTRTRQRRRVVGGVVLGPTQREVQGE